MILIAIGRNNINQFITKQLLNITKYLVILTEHLIKIILVK